MAQHWTGSPERSETLQPTMVLGNLGYSQLALPWQDVAADGLSILFFKVLECRDFIAKIR